MKGREIKGLNTDNLAKEMRDHGRSAIWVASDLLRGEKSTA